MPNQDEPVIGFAYDGEIAAEETKWGFCTIVLIPVQEEFPDYPDESYDDWRIFCSVPDEALVANIPGAFRFMEYAGFTEYFLENATLVTITEALGIDPNAIQRLQYDDVLDQRYFGDEEH